MPTRKPLPSSRNLSALIACFILSVGAVVSQCPDPAVLDQYESPCGSGLNIGQGFTAEATGFLDSVILARCTAADARLVLRAHVGSGGDWATGNIIGEADQVLPGDGDPNGCFTSGGNGFSNYAAGTFTFTNVAVEAGGQYILHLVEGAAATGCNISYSGGTAYSDVGAKSGEDLAFSLSVCPATPVFGCTDASACNYDASATAEDGSCLALDCAGQCGGTAYDDPDCGCVPSIADAGSCIGCTDASACNHDAGSTVDDGSCFYPVCNGACPDILNYWETPCGTGLNYGQGFTAGITGLLNSITIARCSGVDTRLVIRNYNGDGDAWDQGTIIGEADQTFPGNQSPTDCFISGGNGFTYYVETTFTFANIGLEEGHQYVFQLAEGVAATGCTVSYPGGTAFGLNAAKPNEDLVFELSMCPDNLTFGCTDTTACNYDATVDLEDGSCLFLDCQGNCGGAAYLDPDCGCLDSVADAGQCLGCTNPAACNYDPSATASDGSCSLPDCHGECGGTAINSSCGCIGGSTGIPTTSCVDGCLTSVEATDPTACSPGILYGQTITPTENGLLKRVRLQTCCALDAQVVLRTMTNTDPCADGGGGEWNSGTILGYSNTVPSSCNEISSCLTGFGFGGYHWHNFNFDDIPVQAGTTYVLELISGVAVANCASDYAGGTAFNAVEALSEYDLAFSLHICPASMNWGCTDANACTYDPDANQNDGSCQYLDCHGDCGGTAQDLPGCGCIGGNSGVRTSQCVNGALHEIFANDGVICNETLKGQTVVAEAHGFLSRIAIHVMPDAAQTIRLTRSDGPKAGEVLLQYSRSAEASSCADIDPEWVEFDFYNIALQGGSGYRLDFTSGAGYRTCYPLYPPGSGINSSGNATAHDLAFRIVYRLPEPGELVWGCTDADYCNYDPDANYDDGSCTTLDCHGDCGGSAYEIADCGCVEGNTGLTAESCYGCLDASACNFAPNASIDDGSCAEIDCHGDCGGTAISNATCGCVGGNTGIDPGTCLERCQGSLALTTYDGVFNSGNLAFGGSGQTITASSTAFLTAARFRQANDPASPITLEVRALDAPNVHNGTLLASTTHAYWADTDGEGGNLFFEWDIPALLSAGEEYALVLIGTYTLIIQSNGNPYAGGAGFGGPDATASGDDLFFELYTCDDLIGCIDPSACNFDAISTADNEVTLCVFPDSCDECTGETDGTGTVIDHDADDDGVCDDDEIQGCTDATACNYDATPTTDTDNSLCIHPIDPCDSCSGETDGTGTVVDNDADGDGVCNADEIQGCTDPSACNYDATPTTDSDPSLCLFVDGICDTCVNGAIVDNDADNDGVCNADEITGCTDPAGCNYDDDPTTDTDNSLCLYVDGVCETCSGATDGTGTIVDNDADNDGVCNADEVPGCQDNTACNFNSAATDSDGTCVFTDGICETCSGATDGTGTIIDNDADNDGVCNADEITGCTDPSGCNYDDDPTTDTDNSLCIYVDGICETCSGATDGTGTIVDNDADNDGVCDADEITGCTDPSACNYDDDPTTDTDNSLCLYVDGVCETCSGATDGTGTIVDNDADNDGVCNADEITDCTDASACNYDDDPTTDTDNSLCIYVDGVCETCSGATDGTGTIVDNDTDNDGVCDADEVIGCTDPSGCNYDDDPTTDTDNSLCIYTVDPCDTCSGETDGTGTVVDNDTDDDGICNADEITGCTDPAGCNYDATPTTDTDNGLCLYVDGVCETCSGATDGTGTIVDNDADDDGVCNAEEITGCTDASACNYDATPTTDTDNSLCIYTVDPCDTCSGETDGTGTVVDNDTDDDGICNADEVIGCTDPAGCNYDATPTTDTDNSLCIYVDGVCETCSGATDGTGTIVDNDADDDGVCNADEITGCTDPSGCNYDATPTTDTDNSLCLYVDGICETCSEATDGTGTIVDNDTDDDGVCNADEVIGCTDASACNYDATPTTDTDNSLCLYVDGVCETCSGQTDGTGTIVDNDADDDGICNADEITGCTDPAGCNYDATPTTDTDNSLCLYADGVCETCSGASDGTGTIIDNDADDDGVCNSDEVPGCQDNTACNFNSAATDSDGTCVFVDGICETCSGATDGTGTIVDNDVDDDGVCNADEVIGCTDASACNYDATPTTDTDNSLCLYVDGVCDTCSGQTDGTGTIVDNDADDDGICNEDEVPGCTNIAACNYEGSATFEDGSCEFNSCAGCRNPTACNFDPAAIIDGPAGTCTFPATYYVDCNGNCLAGFDLDNNGTCDPEDVTGCMNASASNYNPAATVPSGGCLFDIVGCLQSDACNFNPDATIADITGTCLFPAETYLDCEGGCLNDDNGNGICDEIEVSGCTDATADNFNPSANTDDGSCFTGTAPGCMIPSATNYDPTANVQGTPVSSFCTFGYLLPPGIMPQTEDCADIHACNFNPNAGGYTQCEYASCLGCTVSSACNFDAGAVYNDGSCEYATCLGCINPGACNYDATASIDDGSCTYSSCSGCTEPYADNFDPSASMDDGSCEYLGCTNASACNYGCTNAAACSAAGVPGPNTDDGSCAFSSCAGCQTPGACNYDPGATLAASCEYGSCAGCTDATADNYDASATIDDGSCAFEGCTNPSACNHDPGANADDGSCTYPAAGFNCDGSCIDLNANNICDSAEPPVYGCVNPNACNYDPAATANNGTCQVISPAAGDIVVQLDANGTAAIVPADVDASTDGGCTIASSTVVPDAFSVSDLGTVGALLTITDDQGNTFNTGFTVTVEDNIPPVASANDITLDMPSTTQEVVLTALEVSTSTDNAGIASQSLSKSSFFGCDDVMTHTVTLTVVDFAGNVDQVDFNVTITHPDVDGDGICDDQDNCTDPTANNWNDPANNVCQPCGLAPVFNGFASRTPASALGAADGAVELDVSSGYPVSMELTGLNGSPDLIIAVPEGLGTIPPGLYQVQLRDDDGCFGVASAPGGSTFGQPAITRTLIMSYALCCSGCGEYDVDTDGICDGSDNCTDRTAPNYNDPANGPCE